MKQNFGKLYFTEIGILGLSEKRNCATFRESMFPDNSSKLILRVFLTKGTHYIVIKSYDLWSGKFCKNCFSEEMLDHFPLFVEKLCESREYRFMGNLRNSVYGKNPKILFPEIPRFFPENPFPNISGIPLETALLQKNYII